MWITSKFFNKKNYAIKIKKMNTTKNVTSKKSFNLHLKNTYSKAYKLVNITRNRPLLHNKTIRSELELLSIISGNIA